MKLSVNLLTPVLYANLVLFIDRNRKYLTKVIILNNKCRIMIFNRLVILIFDNLFSFLLIYYRNCLHSSVNLFIKQTSFGYWNKNKHRNQQASLYLKYKILLLLHSSTWYLLYFQPPSYTSPLGGNFPDMQLNKNFLLTFNWESSLKFLII